jgi:hypothetical protein
MLIDPKVKSLVIFNGGGGIVEREMKLSIQQGINEFKIENVPASFDPNSADIKLEHINPEDKDLITLQQTTITLPDYNNSQQIIDREKSAANSIISYAIDFTREMREKVSRICEASSYKTFADMKGTFDFIINSTKEGEVIVKILYFLSDVRIKWDTTLQVNISKDGKTAEIEGFIVVDNQTGFTYENVELGFAIFELPKPLSTSVDYPEMNVPEDMRQGMMNELQSLRTVRKAPMKRTQRFKQLL